MASLTGYMGCPFCSAGDSQSLPALGILSHGSRVTRGDPGFGEPSVAVTD